MSNSRPSIVTDRTLPQNLFTTVPAHVFIEFDAVARRRGLSKSMLLKRVVSAIAVRPRVLDKIIGKDVKP